MVVIMSCVIGEVREVVRDREGFLFLLLCLGCVFAGHGVEEVDVVGVMGGRRNEGFHVVREDQKCAPELK